MLANVLHAHVFGARVAVIATAAAIINTHAWFAGAGESLFHLATVAASVAIVVIPVITLLCSGKHAITAKGETSAGLTEANKTRFHRAGAAAPVAANIVSLVTLFGGCHNAVAADGSAHTGLAGAVESRLYRAGAAAPVAVVDIKVVALFRCCKQSVAANRVAIIGSIRATDLRIAACIYRAFHAIITIFRRARIAGVGKSVIIIVRVTYITNTIFIHVVLLGICVVQAVIACVTHAIGIGVSLVEVCCKGAVIIPEKNSVIIQIGIIHGITCIANVVAIHISLIGVLHCRTIVAFITYAIIVCIFLPAVVMVGAVIRFIHHTVKIAVIAGCKMDTFAVQAVVNGAYVVVIAARKAVRCGAIMEACAAYTVISSAGLIIRFAGGGVELILANAAATKVVGANIKVVAVGFGVYALSFYADVVGAQVAVIGAGKAGGGVKMSAVAFCAKVFGTFIEVVAIFVFVGTLVTDTDIVSTGVAIGCAGIAI